MIVAAWPCGYVAGALVPGTNEMLLEEIHVAHVGLERIAGSVLDAVAAGA